MSLTEMTLNVPVEHMANVFGQFDSYIKKIERALNVTIIIRDGTMKFLGEDANIRSAANVFSKLIELSRRGNEITEQNVDYILSLCETSEEDAVLEIEQGDHLSYDSRQTGQAKDAGAAELCKRDPG